MRRSAVAWVLVAVVYVGEWVWVGAAQPGLSDFASVTLWVASSMLAGLLIGRWWAVALAVVGAIGLLVGNALNPCVDGDGIECDVNVSVLVFGYFMPATAPLLALGVAVRKGLHLVRSSRPHAC